MCHRCHKGIERKRTHALHPEEAEKAKNALNARKANGNGNGIILKRVWRPAIDTIHFKNIPICDLPDLPEEMLKSTDVPIICFNTLRIRKRVKKKKDQNFLIRDVIRQALRAIVRAMEEYVIEENVILIRRKDNPDIICLYVFLPKAAKKSNIKNLEKCQGCSKCHT
jgi:RNase P protein component